MPSSIATTLLLSAVALAIAGGAIVGIAIICIAAVLYEGSVVWVASNNP